MPHTEQAGQSPLVEVLRVPTQVAGAYFLFGVSWIVISDVALLGHHMTDAWGYLLSLSKGLLFVTISSILIFVLLTRYVKNVDRAGRLVRAVIDNSTDAIYVKDLNGRYLLYNHVARELFGKPAHLVLGMDDAQLFDSQSVATIRKNDREVYLTGEAISREEQLTSALGTRTFSTSKIPLRDKESQVIGLVGISRDITEHKRAVDELRDQRNRLQTLTEAVPIVLCSFVTDENGELYIRHASSQISEIFGVNEEALRSDVSIIEKMIPPEDLPNFDALFKVTRPAARWTSTFRVNHPQRGTIWIEGCASPSLPETGKTLWHGYLRDVTEAQQTQQKLSEFQEQFRDALRIAKLGTWYWEPSTDTTYWSDETFKLLGYDPETTQPSPGAFTRLVDPHLRDVAQLDPDEFCSEKHNVASEFPITLEDGSRRWIHRIATPVFHKSGTLQRISGFLQDITDRKRSEEVLRTNEERLRIALSSAKGGAWDWDIENDKAWWSPEMFELWGKEDQQSLSLKESITVIHPDDLEKMHTAIERAFMMNAEYSCEFRLLQPDNSIRWILSRGRILQHSNEPKRLVGISLDITEQKETKIELESAEDFSQKLLASSVSALYVYDLTTDKHVLLNDKYTATLGYSLEELNRLDRDAHINLVHVDDQLALVRFFENIAHAADDEIVEIQFRKRAKAGHWVYCQSRNSVYKRSTDGRVEQFIGTFNDITAQKTLEERLLQAQKMEAVGKLAGGIAHDFNNILTVINGYTDLLLRKSPEESTEQQHLLAVRNAGERAKCLTQQLLSFSRKAIVTAQTIEVSKTIVGTKVFLDRLIRPNISLCINNSSGPLYVEADPTQFDQVILNLAINACDAMPNGGSLQLITENRESATPLTVSSGSLPPGNYAVLSFIDNGHGMAEDMIDRIFEPFFTTKPHGKGTGLGLSVVHGIVKQAGGGIDINSQLNAGTTVTVYWPLSDRLQNDSYTGPSQPTLHRHETILLVEDEEPVRSLCQCILRDHGYQVLAASSADEALTLVRNYGEKIKLMVTDVAMPSTDGFTLADEVRLQLDGLPIVFMSGFLEDLTQVEQLHCDSCSFIRKPFLADDLLELMQSLLKRSEQQHT